MKDKQNEILSLLEQPFPEGLKFDNILEQYAKFCDELEPIPKKKMSELFWDKIKLMGTPIIEEIADDRVKVHFLFLQDNYDHLRKALYIAGDYHGFTSTNDVRQKMHNIPGTDILHRSYEMPKDCIVTYNYIQIDPEFADQNRPFFSGSTEELPRS